MAKNQNNLCLRCPRRSRGQPIWLIFDIGVSFRLKLTNIGFTMTTYGTPTPDFRLNLVFAHFW